MTQHRVNGKQPYRHTLSNDRNQMDKNGGAEGVHENENEDGWELEGLEKGMSRESLEQRMKSLEHHESKSKKNRRQPPP